MTAAYTLVENASLAGRNGFHLAARAELLADVRHSSALPELFGYPLLQRQPVLVLGEGSNVLFAADFAGIVLSIATLGLALLDDDGESALVRAEAGERWDDLVRWSLGHGLCGLENLALIPGTVGASPIQNIGAYGVEVGEFIETVEAWDRRTSTLRRLSRADCEFGYRESAFKRDSERYVITAVEFRLPRRRAVRIDYPGIREELAAMGFGEAPLPSQVAEAISRVRTRKLPNPALVGNVGSFFKNPSTSDAHAQRLLLEHPGMPQYPGADAEQRKLSAAWLIERCGWKGHRDGDAGVAEQHALVLVNHGSASGAQLLALARRIVDSVQQRFDVRLEPEARIVGARFDAWS